MTMMLYAFQVCRAMEGVLDYAELTHAAVPSDIDFP